MDGNLRTIDVQTMAWGLDLCGVVPDALPTYTRETDLASQETDLASHG
jgi:hypothetical protein